MHHNSEVIDYDFISLSAKFEEVKEEFYLFEYASILHFKQQLIKLKNIAY